MDYLQIGSLSFERDASKSDLRLDFCSTLQEAALDCGDLAFDTMEAEVFTKTAGPQLTSLSANTPIIVYRGNEVYARFVKLTVSRIAPNSYRITGRSPTGALTAMTHAGGIYIGQTANDIITEICGNIPVLVESVYSNMNLYGWLPYADGKEKSARDNLTQVLFAIGAYLRTDLNGVLRIEKAWDGTASTIPADRSYSGGTVDYSSPISSISVAEHQYVPSTGEKELFSGTAQAGDIITFSEPMHSLTADGFTILESNANYAILSAGTGTLTGKTYTHNTRLVMRTVTAGAAENVVSVTDATLVSLVNSAAVANRLAEYYKHRETISNGIVAGAEKPGHVVNIYHPYDKKMVSACVESLDTTMSGTIKSNLVALVGFKPPQPETSEYYDERVVLTGDGTWTVPEGVTSVRATCIGGGQGGKCGQPGGLPTSTVRTETSSEQIGSYTYTTTAKGFYLKELPPSEGGAPGEGGHPGKVYTDDLTVVSGQDIAYTCGVGGAGGAYEPETSPDGSPGTASVFGGVSSDSGAYNDSGYTDPISGDIYAVMGEAGMSGGNGVGYDANGNLVTPDPIIVGGVSYVAGTQSADNAELSGGNASGTGEYSGTSFGSLGGGPAYKASGHNGNAGITPVASGSPTDTLTVRGGNQGVGATAQPPEKAAQYGQGGLGGNGGGGNGQSWAYGSVRSRSAKTFTLDVAAGAAAARGEGSIGGQGADGCIILYYRRPKPVQAGWVKDKNGKPMLDRLGRRIIV